MFLKNGGAALAYNPCIPSISFYSHLPLGSWMVGNPLFTNKPVAKGHLWFNDWVWMGTLCQCELGENPGTDWIIHLELQHSWVDRVRIWRHFKHPRIRASLQHWSKKAGEKVLGSSMCSNSKQGKSYWTACWSSTLQWFQWFPSRQLCVFLYFFSSNHAMSVRLSWRYQRFKVPNGI